MTTQAHSNGALREGSPPGVRVYRGRRISDLLPTIRAELGSDAVILRHREGVGGGVGGFFAQRFVEVEAMPADAPEKVDVYDDDHAALEALFAESVTPAAEPQGEEPAGSAVTPAGGRTVRSTLSPLAAPDPALQTVQYARAQPAPAAAPQQPVAAAQPAVPQQPAEVTPQPAVAGPQAPLAPPAPAPAPAPVQAQPLPAAMPQAQQPAMPQAQQPAMPQAQQPALAQPPEAPFVQRLVEAAVQGNGGVYGYDGRPTPAPEPVAPQPVAPQPTQALAPVHIAGGPLPVGDPVAQREAVEAVTAELLERGMSAEHVAALVEEARTHGMPFVTDGDLRTATRRTLARRLAGVASAPADEGIIAFVGAGGAGKTRCSAGLAVAYQGCSALAVTCLALSPTDGGGQLSGLVRGQGVEVRTAPRGGAAAWAAEVRGGGMVVVDTPAVSASDETGVRALADELRAIDPDHVIVALPSTLSAVAARQLLRGLEALRPTGIVVTHVDETDQLGVAVELACDSGLRLAYVHDGLGLPGALRPAEPCDIAERILP